MKKHAHPPKNKKANPCHYVLKEGEYSIRLKKGEEVVEIPLPYLSWRRYRPTRDPRVLPYFCDVEHKIEVLLSQGYVFDISKKGGKSGRGEKALKSQKLSPLKHSCQDFVKKDVKRTVKALMSFFGKYLDKEVTRHRIDIEGLIVALEDADDLTRYLEMPLPQKPKTKVLLTIDVSGSCSGFADSFLSLSKEIKEKVKNLPIEITIAENVNGNFLSEEELPISRSDRSQIIKEFDLVIYFGDFDCIESSLHLDLHKEAQMVVLANVNHNYQNPAINQKYTSNQCLVFQGVTPQEDEDIAYCIEVASRYFY